MSWAGDLITTILEKLDVLTALEVAHYLSHLAFVTCLYIDSLMYVQYSQADFCRADISAQNSDDYAKALSDWAFEMKSLVKVGA